jgi:hypothetical protein
VPAISNGAVSDEPGSGDGSEVGGESGESGDTDGAS